MTYVPTRDQVADLLTKSLPKNQFDSLVSKLLMKDIFKPAWGGVWENLYFWEVDVLQAML